MAFDQFFLLDQLAILPSWSLAPVLICAAAATVVALMVWDLTRLQLPDILVIGLAAAGMLLHLAYSSDWTQSLIGVGVCGGAMLLIFALTRIISKQPLLGSGDIGLMAAAGAWLGPWAVCAVLMLGSIFSLPIVALNMYRHGWRVGWQMPVPYAPGLLLAGVVLVVLRMQG